MDRKPAVQVSEVLGIYLDYRPRDYFWAADLNVRLLSGIVGEARRQLVRKLIEAGRPVPNGLDAAVLDEETRQMWGRLDPSNMGGEYPPPLRTREVEIARISLASVTADQISVRARRSGKRIVYCVVDEYGSDIATYVCRPASSVSPLSLRDLIALMEHACERVPRSTCLHAGFGLVIPARLQTHYSTNYLVGPLCRSVERSVS
jgi:hypothetical protein